MSTKRNTKLNETEIQQLKQYAEELNQLQTDIESNDALSIKHGKAALELALKAGGVLIEAKKLVKHNDWEKWLSENVKGISIRTAQNYMKLAKKAAETQYIALLTEAESLRQAYICVGIIKEKINTEQTGTEQSTPENAEGEITPEKMKKTDKGQYDAKLNEARQKIQTFVRNTIDASKRINWNLSTWTIKNNKPCSDDGANFGAALFHDLRNWVAKREFTSLTHEDEICAKAGIVLSEIVTTIILANTTTKPEVTPEVKLMDIVPPFSMELNRQPVEVAEMTPA